MQAGPESQTLAERIVLILRLPYLLGCLVVTAIRGFLFLFLLSFLGLYDLGYSATYISDFLTQQVTLVPFVLVSAANFLEFYGPRYVRLRTLRAQKLLSPMLPEGEERLRFFDRAYRLMSQGLFSALVFPIFLGLTLLGYSQSSNLPFVVPSATALLVATIESVVLPAIGVSVLIWTYLGTLWGLYKLGGVEMKLKEFDTDRFLGLRPAGSLALSLAVVYFFALGIILLFVISAGAPTGLLAFCGFLTAVGLAFFFVPLLRFHDILSEEKSRQNQIVEEQLKSLGDSIGEKVSQGGIEGAFFALSVSEILRNRVSRIPTFPFDTAILVRLVAVFLAVVGILLARIIYTYVVPF